MNPIEQEMVIREIGGNLLNSVPGEWEEIVFEYSSLADMAAVDLTVLRSNGRRQRVAPPQSASVGMRRLREGMYLPGKGTWYSARYTIQRSGKYRVDYNYDDEPEFGFPPSASSYVLDLQNFPRDDENIPDWLREKLREGADQP